MAVLAMSDSELLRFDTLRQVFRLLERLRANGAAGLMSRKRGRPSNRRYSDALREQIVAIVREHYSDFGPTLAREYCIERHGITVASETLRQMMISTGLWKDRAARRPCPYWPRYRRDCRGEVIQVDDRQILRRRRQSARRGRTQRFHSMPVLLRTPDRQEWRLAMDHTPIFPVADVASFIALQEATRPDPKTGKPDPAAMKPFLAAHPEVKAFQAYMAKAVLPDSFANAIYYSTDAFRFTDAGGTTRLVRWQFVPEAPLAGLDKKHLEQLPRDYLFKEIIARTAKEPSRWHLQLVVANPGHVTDKATVAWTGPHRTLDAGTLELMAVQPEDTGACRDLNFDPTILPPGIAISDAPPAGSAVQSLFLLLHPSRHRGTASERHGRISDQGACTMSRRSPGFHPAIHCHSASMALCSMVGKRFD